MVTCVRYAFLTFLYVVLLLMLTVCDSAVAAQQRAKWTNVTSSTSDSPVRLRHLSTVHLPAAYGPDTYRYMAFAAEQAAFDAEELLLYVGGE